MDIVDVMFCCFITIVFAVFLQVQHKEVLAELQTNQATIEELRDTVNELRDEMKYIQMVK